MCIKKKQIKQRIHKNSEYDFSKVELKIKDLSNLKTYTIDEDITIEIDDAISLEKIDNHYKLWIHIASPSISIEFDSEIDRKARKSISTLYLCTNNIYMFPENIINLFSLKENKKRKSLSLGVILNNDGSIYSYEIVQSIIKTNYRLSYKEADELIDYAPKEEEDLFIISKILEKRRLWRKSNGAIEIVESYGKVVVKNNVPIIKIIDQTLSRILVSEAMVLYGDMLSKYTQLNKIPVPYRVQDNKKLVNINNFNSDNHILNNFQLKKNIGKTYYSSTASSHNSLGLDSYLQATSPIRRYSDLLVHYQIYKFLNNEHLISKDKIDEIIIEINHLSRQNINRFRHDQQIWTSKWFKYNKFNDYRVLLLQWINRLKNICLIYFVEYKFSSICYLKSKLDVKVGESIKIKNITIDYKDLLYFQLNS